AGAPDAAGDVVGARHPRLRSRAVTGAGAARAAFGGAGGFAPPRRRGRLGLGVAVVRARRAAVAKGGGGPEFRRGHSKGGRTMARRLTLFLTIAIGLCCLGLSAHAAGIGALEMHPDGHGGENYSVPVQIMLLMGALVFLPALLLTMTSFTRIIIVLSLLRQALGLTQTPPNQILIGLALFLTMFVMGPVFTQ